MDRRRVRGSGPGRAKFFQFIPVLHRVSVLSGTQKSSTGSNLRYTRCLDSQYPVRTGTPDPRFTRFTGFTWYGKILQIPNLRSTSKAQPTQKRTAQGTRSDPVLLTWSPENVCMVPWGPCKHFFVRRLGTIGKYNRLISLLYFPMVPSRRTKKCLHGPQGTMQTFSGDQVKRTGSDRVPWAVLFCVGWALLVDLRFGICKILPYQVNPVNLVNLGSGVPVRTGYCESKHRVYRKLLPVLDF